jgi:N-acetylglucosamine-6-phosphate deacetylase
MSRTTGMKIVRKDGKVTASDGAVAGSTLMPAAGYALMRASTREELVTHMTAFLAVAGDGTAEVIQVMEPPPAK